MHTALRAGALLIIAGAAAGAILIFATDSAEAPNKNSMTFSLISSDFEQGGLIPARFTCDGDNISPELLISSVPDETKSIALVMDDPDVPKQLRPDGVFDHWVLFNVAPDTTVIAEGGAPGIQGANGRGDSQYTGPCPPSEYEPAEHRYFFRAYALDIILDLAEGASKQETLNAMEGHVLSEAELIGRYSRK